MATATQQKKQTTMITKQSSSRAAKLPLDWKSFRSLVILVLLVLVTRSPTSHAREAPNSFVSSLPPSASATSSSSSDLRQHQHQLPVRDLAEEQLSVAALPPAQGPAGSNHPWTSSDCDQSGAECSPPSDSSFTSNKRLVPTGPNPLHNR